MIQVKSERELEVMRRCGKQVSQILRNLAEMAKPGISLRELDQAAEEACYRAGGKPAFKGYQGYQHSLCTSVNEQIVHGIPTNRKLKLGDIVGLDFGLILDGFFGDSAVTVPIGEVSPEAKALMETTRNSLYAGIDACRAGKTIRDVARAIEGAIRPKGYGIVREFVGHGIGRKLHEDPQIPNYEAGAPNVVLKPGMTICLEPMVNLGSASVRVLDDHWTAVAVDGKLSAHFEHTVAVTNGDPEVLTEWDPPRFESVFRESPKTL